MDKPVEAIGIIGVTIVNCERQLDKFPSGGSHYSLLRNRISALRIAQNLMLDPDQNWKFSKNDLIAALQPIRSIIHKCETALLKAKPTTGLYTRITRLIQAMELSQQLIIQAIDNLENNIGG